MCVAFPLPKSSSWHHLGVPQFNSVLTLSAWRHCQIVSQVQGSVPPHFWCQQPVISPQVTHSLGLISVPRFSARSRRLSWPPPQVQLSFQSSSRTRGSSGLTSLLRGVMRDADTHTGDKEDRVRPGAGGWSWVQEPVGLGCGVIPLLGWTCSPAWSCPGVFMEASSCRRDQLLTLFLGTLLFLESGARRRGAGDAKNSSLLILSLLFRWPALIWVPSRSRLLRTKDTPVTQEFTRVSGALCEGPGQRPNIIEWKVLLMCLSLRNLHVFLEVCARDQGQRPVCISCYLI